MLRNFTLEIPNHIVSDITKESDKSVIKVNLDIDSVKLPSSTISFLECDLNLSEKEIDEVVDTIDNILIRQLVKSWIK